MIFFPLIQSDLVAVMLLHEMPAVPSVSPRSTAKGGTTPSVYWVDPVGEQAAVSGKLRYPIDRRYVVSARRYYERRAMHGREYVRDHDKAASRLAPKGRDGRFDFYVAMNSRNDWHDLE